MKTTQTKRGEEKEGRGRASPHSLASLETEEEHLLSICHDVMMMMMLHSSGLLMSRLGNLGAKVCEILLSPLPQLAKWAGKCTDFHKPSITDPKPAYVGEGGCSGLEAKTACWLTD